MRPRTETSLPVCWLLCLLVLSDWRWTLAIERRAGNCKQDDGNDGIFANARQKKYAPMFKNKVERLQYYNDEGGADIERKCSAKGYPEPTVVWYKDSQRFNETDRISMGRWSLVIRSLHYTDKGEYKCVVTNECGTIEWKFTQDVTVSEIGGPPVMLEDPVNQTVYEGEEVTIRCSFYTKQPPDIFWVKYETINGTYNSSEYQQLQYNPNTPETYVIPSADLNDTGMYGCYVKTSVGWGSKEQWLTVLPLPPSETQAVIHPRSSKTYLTIIAVAGTVFAVILGILFLLIFCMKKKHQRQRRMAEKTVINPIYPLIAVEDMNIPYDSRWELPRENLQMGDVLGEGFFGQVVKAYAIGLFGKMEPVIVAVKMLKGSATDHELRTLVQEMNTMKSIKSNRNIINFLGCCTQNGPLYILVEYAVHGNLRDFLQKQKPPDSGSPLWAPQTSGDYLTPPEERSITPLTTHDLTSFAYQVSKGMEYLASAKIIHRDLAARNILVADDYVLKIGDFGLTKELTERNYYRRQTETPLPIKWMAVECLREKKFTTKSDVWSFGIVLWEMFTFGENPYPGVDILSHDSFYVWLEKGNRMDRPRHSPDEMYTLMLRCWKPYPEDRLDFATVVTILDGMLCISGKKEYLNLEPDYINPGFVSGVAAVEAEPAEYHHLPKEDDFLLEDNVFNADPDLDRAALPTIPSSKNVHRSDSQYCSLSSSQVGSLTPQSSLKSRHGGSSDVSSLSEAEEDAPRLRGFPSNTSIHSYPGQTPLTYTNHNRSHSLEGCHNDTDSAGSEDEDPVGQRAGYSQPLLTDKPWLHSHDSMIYITDDEEAVCITEQKYMVVYSTDKVECVESLV